MTIAPTLPDEALLRVDAFFGEAQWVYLWNRVTERLGDLPDPYPRSIVTALGYMLRESGDPAQYPGYGPFIPIFTMDNKVSAPAFADVPDEILSIWQELGQRCQSPAARARFLDLLWCSRNGGSPGLFGRLAIDEYLELGAHATDSDGGPDSRGWIPYARAECLRRALSLAKELNARDRFPSVIGMAETITEQWIEEGATAAALIMLRSLTDLDPSFRPASLPQLLDRAVKRFGQSVWTFVEIGDLQASLLEDQGERRAIREVQLDRLVAEAHEQQGIVRLSGIQKCIEFAHQHNLSERLPALRRELDGIDSDTLDLKEISAEVQIPREELDRFVHAFARANTFEECLQLFAMAGGHSPSGDHDANLKQVEEYRQQFPVQFLASRMVIDEDGRPIAIGVSDGAADRLELLRQEEWGIGIWGLLGAQVLDAIVEKHGRPTEAQLRAFFEGELTKPHIALPLARAFNHYLNEDFDAAAHVALPRLEAIIREMCAQAGIPVSREAVRDNGGVAGLGTLLHDIDETQLLDKSWTRYLINALTEPAGLNLRNRIAHGLISEVTRDHAVIILHIACYLSILRIVKRQDGDESPA